MNNSQLGSAQWEDSSSVAPQFQFEEGKFWLGRSVESQTPFGFMDDRHICLVSGSRGGKGASIIINNLCLYPGSVVVIDPKGENATVTAARRGNGSEHCPGMGQDVHVLDPFKVARVPDDLRSSFNPMDALDPNDSRIIDEAARIADAIVVTNKESENAFWDEQARDMIQGLILHVLTSQNFDGKRNLITVRKLITSGYSEIYQEMIDEGFQDVPSAQSILWEAVRMNPAYDGILAEIGETFYEMKTNSPKTFQGVLSSANRNTSFINSPDMRQCLEKSDFKLSELKTNDNGVSLYLSLPLGLMNTHYRWLRMIISLITIEMEKTVCQPATGHRVMMFLDEFAGLERMQIIEKAVAQMAGFGVTLFFVLQTLNQLQSTYKDSWETFLANAGMKIFFSVEDFFSQDYVSKFIGDTEIVIESKSENIGKNKGISRNDGGGMSYKRKYLIFKENKTFNTGDGKNYNEGESNSSGTNQTPTKRRLLNPDEVGREFSRISDKDDPRYPGLALVLISGGFPLAVRRANYFEDKFFYKKFIPHPDHKSSLYETTVYPPIKNLNKSKSIEFAVLTKPGQKIEKGSPIYGIHQKSGVRENSPQLTLFSPISGVVKQIGTDNELVVESEHLALDKEIEIQNERLVDKFIGEFVSEAKQAGQKSIYFSVATVVFMLVLLLIFAFIIPGGNLIKCLVAFILLSICYASLEIILSVYRKRKRVAQTFD